MYLVRTPFLLKILYPNFLWDARGDSNSIFVTFDDGPIPIVTPFVLKILKQYDAKATFFCIGDNVRKHPDVFEQVKNDGHAIGNHTFNHLNGWQTADDIYLENFSQADELIRSNLFRPPYGRVKHSQARQLLQTNPGIKIVMWNVLSGDFDISLSPEKCLENVLKNVKGGDIVLFHDSLKAKDRMEYTLPRALEYWSKKGFEFKSLDAGM
jgi:peptidoglycan/xylan/chitin deacetylase (PgdA/CDA1 family)